jgi:hypothetical protein
LCDWGGFGKGWVVEVRGVVRRGALCEFTRVFGGTLFVSIGVGFVSVLCKLEMSGFIQLTNVGSDSRSNLALVWVGALCTKFVAVGQ